MGRAAEVFAEQGAQVLVQEPGGVQPEDQQDVQERLGPGVGQAQPGDAGAVVMEDGVAGRAQDAVPGDGVVAESLDGQQPSVGGGADLPQAGRLVSRLPMPKSWPG